MENLVLQKRGRIQTRSKQNGASEDGRCASGVSTAPTAQLAARNTAHELEMCKMRVEWQKDKIEQLTTERDFLKEQLASALRGREETNAARSTGSSSIQTTISSSSETSVDNCSDSDLSSATSSSEDKKRKKGKGKKKQRKKEKRESKTLQRAQKPDQVVQRYKKVLHHYKRLGTMSGAFKRIGIDRNTVVQNAPIAELFIVAPSTYTDVMKTRGVRSKLSDFAAQCSAAVEADQELADKVALFKTNGKLLPLKRK